VKLVLYPHVLEIGGSQLGALDLASSLVNLGHEVVVFGQPGPLVDRIRRLGLEYIPAPAPRGRPSPPVMRALGQLVRRRRIDLVHGFEWTAALEAYWGPRALFGVPAVGSVMSMAVAPFMPHDMPLIVATDQIADYERRHGRALVDVIEPAVDVRHDSPDAVDPAEFVRRYALDPEALTIICVARLAVELKLEGLLVAIDTVADLARHKPLQLVVVGDGEARDTVTQWAERANARAGRRVVILTGSLDDPRPAHAVADLALGMGTSALRAAAFRTPVIVQGERGFWELLTPDTEAQFLWTGWYGVGDRPDEGRGRLEAALRQLDNPSRRRQLGEYSRQLIEKRFSLERATHLHVKLYERALADAPVRLATWLRPGSRSAGRLAVYRTRRRFDWLRGSSSRDDFNSNPVAAVAPNAAGPDTSESR
jgi:glycosyltransferase involved in cell wall biosynthesis